MRPFIQVSASVPCEWSPVVAGVPVIGGALKNVATFQRTDGPGAVIGTLGRRSGKRYFEIGFAGGSASVTGIQIAISPQLANNEEQAYNYGFPGLGVTY